MERPRGWMEEMCVNVLGRASVCLMQVEVVWWGPTFYRFSRKLPATNQHRAKKRWSTTCRGVRWLQAYDRQSGRKEWGTIEGGNGDAGWK